ncbi:hypothetical protein NC652_006749 [Populus alba x Populus x berolinensis]|nr:hypothetical protein NC652_006749 [Populus alba x Populus x berolinensis]
MAALKQAKAERQNKSEAEARSQIGRILTSEDGTVTSNPF